MKTTEEIYNLFLEERSKNRKKKEDDYYRASSSGMCSRKIYFESILKPEPTNPPESKSLRIMRLGELIHRDIQKSYKIFLESK